MPNRPFRPNPRNDSILPSSISGENASQDALDFGNPGNSRLTISFRVVGTDGSCRSPVEDDVFDELDRIFFIGASVHERYHIVRKLGRGGMGQVFLARDDLLGRNVALKVVALRPDADERHKQEELAKEARLGAALNHRGIATVHDFGLYRAKPFMVFEYIDGQSLREVLRRSPQLSLEEVYALVSVIAEALDYAHSRGIVHRDLKPENICLTEDRQPKLLDFGIARNLHQDFDAQEVGCTPAYAAPEQASGLPTDGRTDQYSLALITFEMLAGRRVFEADSANEYLQLHRQAEPPDLREWRPELPEQVAEAIGQALRKDPHHRFATCQQFAAALTGDTSGPRAAATNVDTPLAQRLAAYLCHSSDDSLTARQLARLLEDQGYATWYYQRDALPGISFTSQASDAIRRSQTVIPLISRSSLSSNDLARDIAEAHRLGRHFLPILVGLSIDDFERHHPTWRPMLGPACVIELERNRLADGAARIIGALEVLRVAPKTDRPPKPHGQSPSVAGQAWATDASQIDVHDLNQVVFQNGIIQDFLERRNKYFLSATKGFGKTLLLTYKRHLLTKTYEESEHGTKVCLVPHGRPFLDFMGELRSLSERYEQPLSELSTTKRLWSAALRISAISHHPSPLEDCDLFELHRFTARIQRWLQGSRVEPTVVFKELTSLPVSQMSRLVGDSENFLDQRFRKLHSPTLFFVDKVDQAIRHLSRDAWINIQAGLIEAAWDLMNANPHIKIFVTIRHEAFVNYQSDIKANLFGATTVLRYSDDELQQLIDRLSSCYEGCTGFRDFLGLNVIKHERRPVPEDSFHFLRRHTFGRPRDLVAIASELSANRSSLTETNYCTLVRNTSASALVANVFDEMRSFLDCLSDRESRARFLAELPANILTRADAIKISSHFNGLSEESIKHFGEESSVIHHPFRDLYLAGLLGVIAPQTEGGLPVQKFRQPDDLVTDFGTPLPTSEYYFLHPALTGLVRRYRTTSHFLNYQHVMVGEHVPWSPYDHYFCEIEKHLAELTHAELSQSVHQLLKRARDILQSGRPENLRPSFDVLAEWSAVREELIQRDADDVLLNFEELLNSQT